MTTNLQTHNATGLAPRTTFIDLPEAKDPTVMKVGKRTIVSDEAAAAWRRSMEVPVSDQMTRQV